MSLQKHPPRLSNVAIAYATQTLIPTLFLIEVVTVSTGQSGCKQVRQACQHPQQPVLIAN